MKLYYVPIILISLFVSSLHAVSIENYTIQQKAMGGVSVATFTQLSQFQSNPAKLALIEGVDIDLLHLNVGFNKELISNLSKLSDIQSETDESRQIEMLKDLTPLKLGGKVRLTPLVSFTKQNMGFSHFTNGQISGALKRKSAPGLELTGGTESNFAFGYARPIKINNRVVLLGVSPKYVSKKIIYDKVSGEDTIEWTQSELLRMINGIDEADVDLYSLSGFGIDTGLLIPFDNKKATGMMGLTIKNLVSSLSGTKDLTNSSSEIKTRDPLIAVLGTSFETQLPVLNKTTLAADYNLIDDNGSFFKRLHLGAEKKVSVLEFRGGVNQGYIVGGLGLNLKIFTLNYAFFGEELGNDLGETPLLTHNIHLGFSF
ncbi:hypothetical protein DID80_05265 [Candidatus Marinamargulisbacteria bacterium SCGC AAA071-K20]|nr:hypothetical protein DID80_05265 [Candidatus Marinamargulisbacteria bacterium SCGC AAA071-K20]